MAGTAGAAGALLSGEIITVLGSLRDVAQFRDLPDFNVLDMNDIPDSQWPRENALWLNRAITRGDKIWLVTDPQVHRELMQELGRRSYYLDLELPMLQQYSGVSVPPLYR